MKILIYFLLVHLALGQPAPPAEASWGSLFKIPEPEEVEVDNIEVSKAELETLSEVNWRDAAEMSYEAMGIFGNLATSSVSGVVGLQTVLGEPIMSSQARLNSVLDRTQTGLDVAGLTPGVGVFPDFGSLLLALARGNLDDAAFSAGAIVPVYGQFVGITKRGRRIMNTDDKDYIDEIVLPNSGSVWMSRGYMDERDVEKIINIVRKADNRPITILSGADVTRKGLMVSNKEFYNIDRNKFGHLPDVTVVDLNNLSEKNIKDYLEDSNITIPAHCNGLMCLKHLYLDSKTKIVPPGN